MTFAKKTEEKSEILMRKKRNFLPVVMTALTLFGGMETLTSDGSVDAVKKVFKEGNYIDTASRWSAVRGSDIPALLFKPKPMKISLISPQSHYQKTRKRQNARISVCLLMAKRAFILSIYPRLPKLCDMRTTA